MDSVETQDIYARIWEYGNNCMQIARVLSTLTPAQIKKHAECFFKQNLKTNSAAVKWHQESLSPDGKAQDLVIDSAAHQKQKQSLSPENKVQILCNDADAHRKQRKSLPPENKVRNLKLMLMHIKRNESLFHLKTKTYLKRIILLHNTNITSHSLLIRKLKSIL
jgi:hypothetical protein